VAAIEQAVTARRIQPGERWLQRVDGQPDAVAGVLAVHDGRCVFRLGGRCDVHRVLGHGALPGACQHFPRECLLDSRGVSVRLSHYCPTAAALLFSHEAPIAIVSGPAAVPIGVPEGLDACDALPPLVSAGVLADMDGYSAWEAHLVSWLGGDRNPSAQWLPEQVLDLLEQHARTLSAWRPGSQSLTEFVTSLGESHPRPLGGRDPDWSREARLFEAVRAAVPADRRWPGLPDDAARSWTTLAAASWPAVAVVVNRYLAGHAFASWMPYLGLGLAGVVSELAAALAVLRVECIRECARVGTTLTAETLRRAVRQADLPLCHLAARDSMARALS
jgi:hypothetical protein